MKLTTSSIGVSIAIAIAILVGVIFFIYPRVYIIGNGNIGTDIAEIIYKHNRSVKDCYHIIDVDPFMGPTLNSQKSLCIYTYAKLAQDSTVCELLLPSEYGLACISETVTQLYSQYPDSGFFDYSECNQVFDNSLKTDWCNYIEAHRKRSVAPCQAVQNNTIRSACIQKFKAWEKYPELRGSSYFGKDAREN